jgi:hypothetical protein
MVWQRGLLDRVQMAPACAGCGQPFAADEAGGRGLYPVVLPLVVLMVLAALKIDDLWRPPLWVYPLVAAPVALVLVGGAVRLAKSAHLAAHVGRGPGSEAPAVLARASRAHAGRGAGGGADDRAGPVAIAAARSQADAARALCRRAHRSDPGGFPARGGGEAVLYRRARFVCRVIPGLWDSVAGRNARGEGGYVHIAHCQASRGEASGERPALVQIGWTRDPHPPSGTAGR